GEDNEELLMKYRPLVRINTLSGSAPQFFFRKWSFVDRVSVADGKVHFRFSPDTRTPGPFSARLKIANGEGVFFFASTVETDIGSGWAVNLPLGCQKGAFSVELRLDERLAYKNYWIASGHSVIGF